MANTKIPSELIADSSITAAKLADGTITTADIANSNVSTPTGYAQQAAQESPPKPDSPQVTPGTITTSCKIHYSSKETSTEM